MATVDMRCLEKYREMGRKNGKKTKCLSRQGHSSCNNGWQLSTRAGVQEEGVPKLLPPASLPKSLSTVCYCPLQPQRQGIPSLAALRETSLHVPLLPPPIEVVCYDRLVKMLVLACYVLFKKKWK